MISSAKKQSVKKQKFDNMISSIQEVVFHPRNKVVLGKWLWSIIRAIFIIGFSFVILYPVIRMLFRAFTNKSDIYDNTVVIVPKHFTLDNIILAAKMIDYPIALRNSLLLTITITIIQTFICMVVGYGFARFNFKFKKVLFALVIFTIVVPPQLLLISNYVHFRFFDVFGIYEAITGRKGPNLINTVIPFYMFAFTAMGLKNGLFIYIFRQFFRGLPRETEEAALVDGAGPIKTFALIMMPHARTVIVTVALFSLVWEYNDTVYTNLFLKDIKVLPTTYSILTQMSADAASMGFSSGDLGDPLYQPLIRSAGVLIMLAPLIIFYLVLQNFFINSIERAGLVG